MFIYTAETEAEPKSREESENGNYDWCEPFMPQGFLQRIRLTAKRACCKVLFYCILSSRFYDLTGLQNGILKRGREIFLTGCYLRTPTGGSGHSRLLPTEYLVILLDEDFQKEIVKAAKTFTAIGYKHIETGNFCSVPMLMSMHY
ncbi:uncharacterized protein LOC114385174 isoform X4 [Glycine soja]|uniref:uncharacterized protein LOC114385174 isoform X4 n=1 Tax=Glycine soja TaxID=3848 RepID=UPI00103CDC2B|nr:uncharacterized protein LOC114385174 isoform X4 [Glycine soja]